MPKVFPFRGYRYAERKVGDLGQVVTQPYDKISDEARRRYLSQSNYNVAHVISNPDYEQAGAHFDRWIQKGFLIQDPEPAFYIYRQEFELAGQTFQRTGAIGLLDLNSSEAGVLRHERVMDAPLQDRLNLIAATESNDGLIFMLVDDQETGWESRLDQFVRDKVPDVEVQDEFEVQNRLWKISVPREMAAIQSFLAREKLYIADGHHRFETAIRFSQQCQEKGWEPAAVESFDKRMIALFGSRSPGVVILPTHRAIRGVDSELVEGLLPKLEESFKVAELADLEALQKAMGETDGSIGLLMGSEAQPFLLVEQGARERLPEDLLVSARELDVNLLHLGILEPHLGIGETELVSQKHVDYHRYENEIVSGLESGKYQMAFLLNPTTLEQVRKISEEGGRMPQKSTDFFPKLLTGLVFMKMEIKRNEK